MYVQSLNHVQLFATPWAVAHQASLSMGILQAKYWSGLSCSPPGDLPNPGIKPRSPTLQADSLPAELQGKPKNTGVGSLSLLQWIFLTQESNWGNSVARRFLVFFLNLRSNVACVLSCIQLFATPWTAAHQAPLSKGFPRQE